MLRFLPLCAALAFTEHPIIPDAGTIKGWSADERELAVWGDRVVRARVRGGSAGTLPVPAGPYTEGGALFERGIVLNQAAGRKALLYFRDGSQEEIATGVEARDVLPARLFGRSGLLAIQKGIDLRFYWRDGGKWRERVLYSIYTPSFQGGIALDDVDGDGRTDIYCGNYWLRSPARFHLHWRLFAINVWSEEERSATMRLARGGGGLMVAQRDMTPARLARFAKPADPTQMWTEIRLADSLAQPQGLAVADFDGDGAEDVAAGEAAGAKRLLLHSGGQWNTLRQGQAVLGLRAVDGDLLVITDRSVYLLDFTASRERGTQ
jgi:hypothetical protein